MRSLRLLGVVGLVVCVVALAALAGCEMRESRTSAEVIRGYASAIVEGRAVGTSGWIQAESWDEQAGALRHLRVDVDRDRIFTAELGYITVDPATDRVSIKLVEVVGADATAGGLVEADVLTMEPVDAGYDIVWGE